jgi:pyruvate formate lyase activating enzyme
VKEAAETSFVTGGNIKFDLKFFNENLSLVVSGVSNKLTFENFKMIAEEFWKDCEVPMLTATTLLVPGYVDELEVENIAKFISSLSEDIPYSLLVFHPCYEMSDLPITPIKQVVECYTIAKRYLKNVRVGNLHLLGF